MFFNDKFLTRTQVIEKLTLQEWSMHKIKSLVIFADLVVYFLLVTAATDRTHARKKKRLTNSDFQKRQANSPTRSFLLRHKFIYQPVESFQNWNSREITH